MCVYTDIPVRLGTIWEFTTLEMKQESHPKSLIQEELGSWLALLNAQHQMMLYSRPQAGHVIILNKFVDSHHSWASAGLVHGAVERGKKTFYKRIHTSSSLPPSLLPFLSFSFLFLDRKVSSCFIFYINKCVVEPLTWRTGCQKAKQ